MNGSGNGDVRGDWEGPEAVLEVQGTEEHEEYEGHEEQEEYEAEARELFARTVLEDRPRLGFTPEDLVLGGRRKVRRRRVASVAASTASVAALAAAATAFTGGFGTAVPGGTASPSSTATSSSAPLSPAEQKAVDQKLAAAALSKMLGDLDPGGKHLTSPQLRLSPTTMNGTCTGRAPQMQDAYMYTMYWTADGRPSYPRNAADTSPILEVTAMVSDSSSGQNEFPSGEGWTSSKSDLPDGSVLQVGSTAGGHQLQAARTLKDRREIVVFVVDQSVMPPPQGYQKPKPTEPFPYTVQELGAVVSGMSLPLPFPNGEPSVDACDGAGPA